VAGLYKGGGREGDGVNTVSFADATTDPAQAALDEAIDLLDDEAIDAAMRKMLQPALDAIAKAATPDEVRQALLDAWPEMDASQLQELMQRAFFVADLAGVDSAKGQP
jgi:phage gp29-like protein